MDMIRQSLLWEELFSDPQTYFWALTRRMPLSIKTVQSTVVLSSVSKHERTATFSITQVIDTSIQKNTTGPLLEVIKFNSNRRQFRKLFPVAVAIESLTQSFSDLLTLPMTISRSRNESTIISCPGWAIFFLCIMLSEVSTGCSNLSGAICQASVPAMPFMKNFFWITNWYFL